jgi:hypothetical protein
MEEIKTCKDCGLTLAAPHCPSCYYADCKAYFVEKKLFMHPCELASLQVDPNWIKLNLPDGWNDKRQEPNDGD